MTIRSDAKVLGIAGGVIGLFLVILLLSRIMRGGLAYLQALHILWGISTRFFGEFWRGEAQWLPLVLVSAILGLIGGAIVKGKPLRGSIFMLVGGGFLLYWSWLLPAGLLLMGGILSLVSWKQSRDKSRV